MSARVAFAKEQAEKGPQASTVKPIGEYGMGVATVTPGSSWLKPQPNSHVAAGAACFPTPPE